MAFNCGRRHAAGLIIISAVISLFCVVGAPVCTSEAMQPPVLLIHGYQPVPGYTPKQLWQTLAESLSGDTVDNTQKIPLEDDHSLFYLPAADSGYRDVFISDYGWDYEPTARDIRLYSVRVADEIAWITDALKREHVDVVAHSMGGLIARAYIEADDFLPVLGEDGFTDYGVFYREDVRVLVTLATPHQGIGYAAYGDWLGPAVRQMSPDSEFLRLLNSKDRTNDKNSSLHAGVIYVTFAGQSCLGCRIRGSEEACLHDCVAEARRWAGSDGVVPMASARLTGVDNHACVSIEHTGMRAHPAICAAVVATLNGRYVPEFIYTSADLRYDEAQL